MSSALPTPKLIVFDWDNTLVNTGAIIDKARSATLRHFGIANTVSEFAPREDFFAQFSNHMQSAEDFYLTQYKEAVAGHIQLMPNAQEALQAIFELGIACTILSNKLNTLLLYEVKALQLAKYFKLIVGSKDCKQDKPSAIPLDFILNRIGMSRGEDVWLIGDAEIDMECASNAGCFGVLFGEHQVSAIAKMHVSNHAALLNILRQL